MNIFEYCDLHDNSVKLAPKWHSCSNAYDRLHVQGCSMNLLELTSLEAFTTTLCVLFNDGFDVTWYEVPDVILLCNI